MGKYKNPLTTLLVHADGAGLAHTFDGAGRIGGAKEGTLENAVDAFSYLAQYNKNQRLLLQTPAGLTRGQEPPDGEGARLIIEAVLTEQRKVLTEPESMAVLNSFRIPTVRNAVAHSANEALTTLSGHE